MTRLLPTVALLLGTFTVASACAYEQPYYQPGWRPAPAHAWYHRPPPPPRGWSGPRPGHGWHAPPRAWSGPQPGRGWDRPAARRDQGWGAPRPTRYEQGRRAERRDGRRDERRW